MSSTAGRSRCSTASAVISAKPKPTVSSVRPRPAASLVLVRRDQKDPEFLLGRRPATMAFMPNAYVFSGGLLAPEDRHIQPASPLNAAIIPHLAVGKDSRLAQVLAAAAVRETFEETGLLLGQPGDVGTVVASSSWLAFKQAGLAPDLGRLRYIARAITPTSSPLRFHARFFLTDITEMMFMPQESTELRDPRWITLAQAETLALAEITHAILLEAARLLQDTTSETRAVFSYHRLHGSRVQYRLCKQYPSDS